MIFLFEHIPIFSETFSLHRKVNICTYDRAPLYNWYPQVEGIIKLMLNVEHTRTHTPVWWMMLIALLGFSLYVSLLSPTPHFCFNTFEALLQNAAVFVIMLIFLSLVSICLLQLLATLFRSMHQKGGKKKKKTHQTCIMMNYLFLQHHITMNVLLDICTNGKKQFFCFQWLI